MVESKQYKKSLQNLENKIGDKNVNPISYYLQILQFLQKKVVTNPKYAAVKSQINTGATMKNV